MNFFSFLKKTYQYGRYRIMRRILQSLGKYGILREGPDSLVCSQGTVEWRHHQSLLLQKTGFVVAFFKEGKWHDCSQVAWKIEKKKGNTIEIVSFWPFLKMQQITRLTLQEGVIQWEVVVKACCDLVLEELKVGIFVPLDFSRWAAGCEEGKFSRVGANWQEMNLKDAKACQVAVYGHEKDSVPYAIMLDSSDPALHCLVQIQNAPLELHTHALFLRWLDIQVKKDSLYSLKGTIQIFQTNTQFDMHIEQYRRRLYTQALSLANHCSFKVMIANLPWYEYGRWGVRAGSRWPHLKDMHEKEYLPFPFFCAYTAALLKKHGFEVVMVDALAEQLHEEEFLIRVAAYSPTLLVCETSIPSMENDVRILSRIAGSIKKAICGPNALIFQQQFLEQYPFIEYVLEGEYEYTVLELAEALHNTQDTLHIKGLMHRDKTGHVIKNAARPLLENIDMLPWPERDTLPMYRYVDTPGSIPLPSAQMWASRGCPFSCAFCAWPQLMYGGSNYRMRNPKDIVDEMEYLVHEKGFRSIYFDDDTFNVNASSGLALCAELMLRREKGRVCVPWAIMARPDLMTEELLIAFKKAGLYAVKYGVESSSQALLDAIGKRMDIKKAEAMILLTQRVGIKTHLTFTFGLPGETQETIKDTIAFVLHLNPTSVQFSLVTPFPGTAFYSQMKEAGNLVDHCLTHFDGNRYSVIKTQGLKSEELEYARKKAYILWEHHVNTRRSLRARIAPLSLAKKFIVYMQSFGIKNAFSKALHFFLFLWNTFIVKAMQWYSAKKMDHFLIRHERKTYPPKSFPVRPSLWIKTIHAKNTYLRMLGVLHGKRALVGPEIVQIDITNQCDHFCRGCWIYSDLLQEQKISQKERNKTLPFNKIKELIDECVALGVARVQLSGGGEPLMHPQIREIMSYIKQKKLLLHIITNGVYLDKTMVDLLCALRVETVTVSLWATTEQLYANLHQGRKKEDYAQLLKNISYCADAVRTRGGPQIRLYYVVCHENASFLVDVVRLAKKIGIDCVEYAVIDIIPGKTDALMLTDEDVRSIQRQVAALAMEKEYFGYSGIEMPDLFSLAGSHELSGFGKFIHTSGLEDFIIDFQYPRVVCPHGKINTSLHARQDNKNIFVVEFQEEGNTQDPVCASCNRCIKMGQRRLLQVRYGELKGIGSFLRRVQEHKKGYYDYSVIDDIPCLVGWWYARISPHGNVSFCCKACDVPIGNIYQHSFRALWNNRVQQQWRYRAKYSSKTTHPFFEKIGCGKICDNRGLNMQLNKSGL